MELFSARDSYHESIRHLCGLHEEASYPKYLLSLKDGLEPPRGSRGEATLTAGPPLGPHLNENSDWTVSWGPSPLPCSSVLPFLWRFSLKYLVPPNLVINLMLQ